MHTLRLLSVVLLLASISMAADEDTAAGEPASDPAEQFATAKTQWDTLEKDIQKIKEDFQGAEDEAQREELKKKYEAVVAKAPGILKNMRAGAEALYTAEPNKDPDVAKTLVRMLADDVRRDDYEPALKLAKLLIDNKVKDQSVYNFAGVAAYGVDDFTQAEEWLKLADAAGTLDRLGSTALDDIPEAKLRFAKEKKVREKESKEDDLPRVRLETNRGAIVIELFENQAPETVGNFVSLVEKGFYNGLTFHRVLPNFMAQGGDPDGTGGGGPGYQVYCECEKPEHRDHFRGTLSMAHAGKNTGGSQFFLTFRPTPHLDGRHTAFGRVIEGFDVLTKLQRREPRSAIPADKIVKAEVVRKRDHKYEPRKVE
jgi:cyclophilin family peptidyl-prolyl cis-trans isomerase